MRYLPHLLAAGAGALLLSLGACHSAPPAAVAGMDRFNPSLCPKDPPENLSRPMDPQLQAAKAELAALDRFVQPAGKLRLSLTLKNIGLKEMVLELPQQAFTLEGFELVDHNCVHVPYKPSGTAHALAYRNSGPIPLNVGESATLDSTLDGLAPGLELRRGIYAIRLALRLEPVVQTLRGRTLHSDWALFAVRGLQ